MSKKKLNFIFENNKFSRDDIMRLLSDKTVVEHLSFIDDDKLELINNNKKFNSWQLNSSSDKIIALLQDQKIVEHINFIDYEKLQFMLYDNKFLLHQVIALLKNQEVVKRINLISPEKLELIFNKFSFEDIKNLLENEQTAWNLRFAIPMLKAGKIYNIDLNYLSNNKNVHKDIIEYLYSNPSIELLIKHYDPNLNKDSFAKFSTFAKNIACEEPVSKLYNLSLE